MAERVFSIDFGNSFTKVALRRDPTAQGELVPCDAGEDLLWVPSIVAMDQRKSEPTFEIGEIATGIKPGGGISVFTNFKKDLLPFHPPPPPTEQLPPLDALLRSEEFAVLATKYAVPSAQLTSLRRLIAEAQNLSSGLTRTAAPAAVDAQEHAFRIAYQFFRGLRNHVLASCKKLPAVGLKYDEIPVRVAVPAFPSVTNLSEHSGCKLLCDALQRAGWPLHPERPLVTEPEANAVGVLTNSTNLLTRAGRINLGEMFNKGPLITVLKGDKYNSSYRALVIDIGAYTTDFASVSVDTEGKNFTPTVGAGFSIQQESVPIGVLALDHALHAALPKEKGEWLNGATRKDFSAVLRNIYTDGKGFRVPGGMIIGGEADRDATQSCLSEFAKRLTDELARFIQPLKTVKMQELILTGGGSNVFAVRDAIIAAAAAACGEFAKVHAPDLKRGRAGTQPVDKLGEALTRGASALGGASIYFEREYYD